MKYLKCLLHGIYWTKCPCCDGTGTIIEEDEQAVYLHGYPVDCSFCAGKGEVEKSYLRWLKRGGN